MGICISCEEEILSLEGGFCQDCLAESFTFYPEGQKTRKKENNNDYSKEA